MPILCRSSCSHPNVRVLCEQIWNHFLMLPMLALLHLFHEFRTHQFGSASDIPVRLDSTVDTLHQVVSRTANWILKSAGKGGSGNKRLKLVSRGGAAMKYGNGL